MTDNEKLIDVMLSLDTMLVEGGNQREQCELILNALAEHGFRSSLTPTDNERTWATGFLLGCGVDPECAEEYAGKFIAGFRRSEVPEPSGERELTPCGNLVCTGCRLCGCPALGIEPQGEPSDAQVLADEIEDRMRRLEWLPADLAIRAVAALRSAGGVR